MKICVKTLAVLILIYFILSCEINEKNKFEESEYLVISSLYSGNNIVPRIKIRTLDIEKGIVISWATQDLPEIYNNNINLTEKIIPSEFIPVSAINTIKEDNILINYYVQSFPNNDYEVNDILLIILINEYIGKFILSVTEIKNEDNTYLFYENNCLIKGDGNNILNKNGRVENIDLIDLYENIIYSFIIEQDVNEKDTNNIIKLTRKIINEIY